MGTLFDFTSHNVEAWAVRETDRAGHPVRVPVTFWTDARFFLLDENFNPGAPIANLPSMY